MRVKPIQKSIVAIALTNPHPNFVSQCAAGANQRAFTRIKKLDVGALEVSTGQNEGTTMTAKSQISKKAGAEATVGVTTGFAVKQFAFSSDHFATKEAVAAWLDDGGYVDYEVVETAKGFEVTNDVDQFEVGSMSAISDATPGVSVYVGKLIPVDPDAVIESADDLVAKAALSPPARVRGAKTGEDDTAGTDAGSTNADASETNTLRAKEIVTSLMASTSLVQKGVWEASTLGDIVHRLAWLVYDADYAGMSEATIMKIKEGAVNLLEGFMLASEEAAEELLTVFKSLGETEIPPTEAAKVDDTSAVDEDAVAVDAVKTAEEIAAEASEITPAVEGAQVDMQEAIRAAITEALQPITEALANVREDAAKAAQLAIEREAELLERLKAAENSGGQTSKGIDDAFLSDTLGKPKVTRSRGSDTILRAFGSTHAKKAQATPS